MKYYYFYYPTLYQPLSGSENLGAPISAGVLKMKVKIVHIRCLTDDFKPKNR